MRMNNEKKDERCVIIRLAAYLYVLHKAFYLL